MPYCMWSMIDDARRLRAGSRIETDLCIVGGGAAGITLARELAHTGMRIVLLVGGRRRERAADRELYRGSAAPGTSHEPLEENRRRCWGGTTTVWGGRCIPLDPIDFEAREQIPYSGWPVSYHEMVPFYERANRICQAGTFAYEMPAGLSSPQREMILNFDGPNVVSTRLERWSPPTNFGRHYRRELRSASNVRVMMNAHVTGIRLAAGADRVTEVDVCARPGEIFTVAATDYVLACGGLENPRLLLASNDVAPEGVGNAHGNVGRFYMSHLIGSIATVELTGSTDTFMYNFERDAEGVYCRRRLWVTAETQRTAGIGNGIAEFYRPDVHDVGHRNALFSATFLAKTYGAAFSRRSPGDAVKVLRETRSAQREHWTIVIRDLPSAVPQVARLAQQRFLAKRRLPIVLGALSGNQVELRYQTEHVPNPESRLELGSTRDAHGMPRLITRVAFSDIDFETVVRFHEVVARQLEASGVGTLHYKSGDLRARLEEQTAHFNSSAHHLGTTRMSTRPEDGVVDADCRVHGVDNLHVVGSSVFPTGGHANPTLTIVALALRLADHLRERTQARIGEPVSATQ
jgi:choline dehydrogenase-like flavoprotein